MGLMEASKELVDAATLRMLQHLGGKAMGPAGDPPDLTLKYTDYVIVGVVDLRKLATAAIGAEHA
jgi:hypothetical protein